MPVLLAAAVLFFVALLPAGRRCQGMGAGGTRDLALPPVPSWQSQVLLGRIHSLGRDLTDEVQRKYGFCMANVQNDFSQAFDFPDTTFVSDCDCMEQTRACPLGAYCPLGTLNETTGICDPYSYQITPGSNLTCGNADSWADVITTNDVFCPPGHHYPTTTQKFNCSKGYYCLN